MTRHFVTNPYAMATIWPVKPYILLLGFALGCTSSVPEDRVDLEPLYRSVEALCDSATCGDYSTHECKRYVFEDLVGPAFFAADENQCLDASTAYVDCITTAGMCDEMGCPFPEAECAPADIIPSWTPPAVVRGLVSDALAYAERCGLLYAPQIEQERRAYVAKMTARLLGIRYGFSTACYDAFVAVLRCEISLACDADSDVLCAEELSGLVGCE